VSCARRKYETFTYYAGSRCSAVQPVGDGENRRCRCQFFHLGDIVKQVGGEHVKVTTLVGPDGDPHSFEPSPKDSKVLSQADVVFVSGLGLEGWIDRLVSASGIKGRSSPHRRE
jgi:hypothetical protein